MSPNLSSMNQFPTRGTRPIFKAVWKDRFVAHVMRLQPELIFLAATANVLALYFELSVCDPEGAAEYFIERSNLDSPARKSERYAA
jgi:hypothetical protein